MPRFIHARAKHLLAKNPKMEKSQAFAIATQQSHKLGKSPKGYGTVAGKREASAKYKAPRKSYEQRANPGSLKTPKLAAAKKDPVLERGLLGNMAHGAKLLTPVVAPMAAAIEGVGHGLGAGMGGLKGREAAAAALLGAAGGAVRGAILGAGMGASIGAAGYAMSKSKAAGVVGFHAFADELSKIAKSDSKSPKPKTNANEHTLNEPTDQEYGDEKEEVKVSGSWAGWDEGDHTLEGTRFPQASHVPPFRAPKLRKEAFAKSQYSGPLGYGGFPQASYIPPFKSPPLRKFSGPEPKGKVKQAYDPSPTGNVHMPGMRKMKTPAIGLAASKNVAQIKETPPGPSIAQIAKPKGYGQPAPGAIKY